MLELREFVSGRLATAAMEICGEFDKTIALYQAEVVRYKHEMEQLQKQVDLHLQKADAHRQGSTTVPLSVEMCGLSLQQLNQELGIQIVESKESNSTLGQHDSGSPETHVDLIDTDLMIKVDPETSQIKQEQEEHGIGSHVLDVVVPDTANSALEPVKIECESLPLSSDCPAAGKLNSSDKDCEDPQATKNNNKKRIRLKHRTCPLCQSINPVNQRTCRTCFNELKLKQKLRAKEERLCSEEWRRKIRQNRNSAKILDSANIYVMKLHELGFKPILFIGNKCRGQYTADIITRLNPIPEGPQRDIFTKMTTLHEHFMKCHSKVLEEEATAPPACPTSTQESSDLFFLEQISAANPLPAAPHHEHEIISKKRKKKPCPLCQSMNPIRQRTCRKCFNDLKQNPKLKAREEMLSSGNWGKRIMQNRNSGKVINSARICIRKLHEVGYNPILFMGRQKKGCYSAEVITRINPIPEGPRRDIFTKMTLFYEHFLKYHSVAYTADATTVPESTSLTHESDNVFLLNLILVPTPTHAPPSLSSPPSSAQSPSSPTPTTQLKVVLGKRVTSFEEGCSGCGNHSKTKKCVFEKVMDQRSNQGKDEIKVHWKPCEVCGEKWEDTWEPASNFSL